MRMYERYEMREELAKARQRVCDLEDELAEYEAMLERKGGATTREEAEKHADLELALEDAWERADDLEAEYEAGF